ncbi:MAG: type II toxin-antitoxin system PemK/MazF family toxin [Acidobacteria bacterium]|nr:type II toxin-antitoxin system PemK/MazF family toxin [Acidobacteriota bacterium]
MKRGDVFWAELAPRSGSEQSGRRPVIIVSHDSFNQTSNWRSVIVVPISTSDNQLRRSYTVVLLPAGAAGLQKPSVAICHQVTTLDRAKLSNRLGALSPETLHEVDEGVKAALDLD